MSLFSIDLKPLTDEPSNPTPSLNKSTTKNLIGIVMWCVVPGISVNLKSTILISRSLVFFNSSSGELQLNFIIISPYLIKTTLNL